MIKVQHYVAPRLIHRMPLYGHCSDKEKYVTVEIDVSVFLIDLGSRRWNKLGWHPFFLRCAQYLAIYPVTRQKAVTYPV